MVTFDGSLVRSIATQAMTLIVPLAVALLGPSCKSDPGGSEGGNGSSTGSSETDGNACMPGETRVCVCPGGFAGVETCNFDGSGFSACDCSAVTTATNDGTTTNGDTTSDVTTDGPSDSTGSSSGDVTTTTDSGPEESSSTGGGDPAYQPCPNGNLDCPASDDVCVTIAGGMPGTVCSVQDCVTELDCPPAPGFMPACNDVTGEGVDDCHLACRNDLDCPVGMDCFMGAVSFCFWT